jgi:hypothetical protein
VAATPADAEGVVLAAALERLEGQAALAADAAHGAGDAAVNGQHFRREVGRGALDKAAGAQLGEQGVGCCEDGRKR